MMILEKQSEISVSVTRFACTDFSQPQFPVPSENIFPSVYRDGIFQYTFSVIFQEEKRRSKCLL